MPDPRWRTSVPLSVAVLVLCLPLLAGVALPGPAAAQEVVKTPRVVMGGLPFSITFQGGRDQPAFYQIHTADGKLLKSGTVDAGATAEVGGLVLSRSSQLPLQVRIGGRAREVRPPFAPGWYSILPPLVAIGMALVFREVLTALFAGVWLGALAVGGWNPISGTWRLIDTYAVPALADSASGHTQIIIFSLLLGGMVGIVSRCGGTMGIVEAVAPFARTRRRGKLAGWLAGVGIFFDDYANTLIVGNTMRPITDRLRISREKLAYLVDSTAAPVSSIIPISTWVGYEISLIADGLRIAASQPGITQGTHDALLSANSFSIFVESIPFRFYPVLALIFVFLSSWMNRDFGPMAKAEIRAAEGRGLYREGAMLATDTSEQALKHAEGAPLRWWNAAIPVGTVVLVVLVGLWVSGRASVGPGASIMDVFGAADPFATLLWGSLAGVIVAVFLSLVQRILTLQEAMEAMMGGMRAMMIAMLILVLAWSLGSMTETLGTAPFLAQILSDRVMIQLIPVLVFLVSAVISFATGTSWGTMAILIPLVIPLTVSLGVNMMATGPDHYTLILGAVSSVLAGSVFGDHCSPISDTTVLSSTASGCDHVDHVRTQLPYAVTVALVGMAVGDVPTAFGFPVWVSLFIGTGVLWLILRFFGRKVEEYVPETAVAEAVP